MLQYIILLRLYKKAYKTHNSQTPKYVRHLLSYTTLFF